MFMTLMSFIDVGIRLAFFSRVVWICRPSSVTAPHPFCPVKSLPGLGAALAETSLEESTGIYIIKYIELIRNGRERNIAVFIRN